MLAERRIIRFADGAEPMTTVAVRLGGELDLAARRMLVAHLTQLGDKQSDRLVIDLAGVSYMDCGMAPLLLDLARSTLSSGAKPSFATRSPWFAECWKSAI